MNLDRRLVLLLAVICALTIGNLYLAQPLLEQIARYFGRSASEVGSIATLSQLGYGTGVLLLVPLGDLVERRKLIYILLTAVTVTLVLAGVAPSLAFLSLASLLIGFSTVVPQVIIPYSASLAPPETRASVIGTVQSGLLIGILLARTFSGAIASVGGWRSAYLVSALLSVCVIVVVKFTFPRQEVGARSTYFALLKSMFTLVRRHDRLWKVSFSGGLNFAAFCAFWTTLAFLLESSFHYGPGAAGLFGLVGVVGALMASLAGRVSDRRGAHYTQLASTWITLFSFVIYFFAEHSLALLILGVIVMDAGAQANHIACQADVFSIDHEARSRLNGIYMFIRFTCGAIGSGVGAWVWSHCAWSGVSVFGLAVCVVSFVPILLTTRRSV